MKDNLSRRQYGALNDIVQGFWDVNSLRRSSDITLWSLLYRGYLKIAASGAVNLSDKGKTAYYGYREGVMPLRKLEADMTERSKALLSVARRKGRKKYSVKWS